MKRFRFTASREMVTSLFMVVLSLLIGSASAHSQATPLVTSVVDETKVVELKGNVSPLIKDAIDLGPTDASQPAGRLLLLLKRSDAQEADLQSFLQQAHEKSSPNYHQWLTPAAFGKRFGADDSDIEQVKGWLQSQGLVVAKVSSGKGFIEYTGTVGQVNAAFHTSIHAYTVKGVKHYANASNPSIPAALAPVVASIGQLDDFKPVSEAKVLGRSTFNAKTHTGTPQWTYPSPDGSTYYFMTPEDFSTQYDVKSVYSAGVTGAGQTIGIINESNIDLSLVNAYRKLFGLPANPPQVVIDGSDPGITAAATEAYLDVENAGAIAPAATVKLYISGSYGIVGGGINFSIIRAVDDDDASVLSLSFGFCESELGTAGNQFINSVWEQAAAQGQTVFVASGDSGSFDGCYGLGVSGLSSTPWNIAVGGTDAYFSDYATGGASIANYWNSTNDANLGSLQKPFTEQPWNGSIYGFNSTYYDPYPQYSSEGGGGGASSCAVGDPTPNPATGLPTCISGYPKPSWQVGLGVPSDGVRDVPDVSLFAADTENGIAWAICAEPGDCTEDLPGGTNLLVTNVGGTSASAPSMAGILALVNQKYGPQGQANYILYPLAAQFPSVINPVDVGSNNEPCSSFNVGFEIGCAADPGNTGNYSLQHYAATPGYSQAAGLGSVDVTALIANWGSVTLKPSVTTLSLLPSTITHGQIVTANATVTGTGVPIGSVALVSSAVLPGYKGLGIIPLGANGTGTFPVNDLPGGTYTVYGQYSGDGINAASKSAATTVTVTPEASVIQFTPQYLNFNNGQVTPLPAGGSVSYDNELVLDAFVHGASYSPIAPTFGQATGSVTFFDNGTALGTVSLSSQSTAELTGFTLGVGNHSITLSYSGDPSYQPSTTAAFNFTVKQQTSGISIQLDEQCQYDFNQPFPPPYDCVTGQTTVNAVTVYSLSTAAGAATTGAPPSGTVSYQYGSGPFSTVTLSPASVNVFNVGVVTYGAAFITLPNMPTGTQTLTVNYSGDANYSPSSTTQIYNVAPSPLALSSTTLALTSPTNLTNVTPATPIVLTMTVTGANGVAPTGTVQLYSLGALAVAPTGNLVPGTNATSTAVITFAPLELLPGQNLLTATYSGDNNYLPSTSAPLTGITDSFADFTIQTQTPNLAVAAGATGSAIIGLDSLNGFSGTVALACSAPTSTVCSLSASSVSLNGTASVPLTLNAFTTSTARNTTPAWLGISAAPALACLLAFFLPGQRRYRKTLVALLVTIALAGGIGCSHTSSQPPAIVTTTTTPAAAGTYNVVITGTAASGIIHNTVITVVIQ